MTGVKAFASTSVQLSTKHLQVGAARGQDAPALRLVGDREQQVLEPDGVVAPVGCHAERALNRLQRFRRERHGVLLMFRSASGSMVTSRGNSCSSAICLVSLQLRFGDVVCIDAGDPDARSMHAHHDGKRFRPGLPEHRFEHPDHEFLRRVVVVVQKHAPHPGALELLVLPRVGQCRRDGSCWLTFNRARTLGSSLLSFSQTQPPLSL